MPQLRLPADAPERSRWWRIWPVFALAAAALALAVVRGMDQETPDPGGETWRGALDLEIHRVRTGDAAPQGALIAAREGDRIQYQVVSPEAGWLSVYNVQDDGEIQTYLAPRSVDSGEAVTGAVVLDGYGGAERIFFVVGDAPVEQDAIGDATEDAWRQTLPELDSLPGLGRDVTQRSVLVIKEESP